MEVIGHCGQEGLLLPIIVCMTALLTITKSYEDAAAADLVRYHQERKTVLGLDPPSPAKAKAT